MSSTAITELENQLNKDMGFPPEISKKAALVCGDISDPDQRLIAAINFIETDLQENEFTLKEQHNLASLLPFDKSLESKSMKMTVCIRKDISMSPGKIASQVAHACLQIVSKMDTDPDRKLLVNEWQQRSCEKIVVLECHSLESIKSIQTKASELGVYTAPIADAGRTEVDPGTITCMAVGPNYEHIVDKITGHLKLLK